MRPSPRVSYGNLRTREIVLFNKTFTLFIMSKTLKLIAVDERNYKTLKNLGKAGDSFNDVITALLRSSQAGGTSK